MCVGGGTVSVTGRQLEAGEKGGQGQQQYSSSILWQYSSSTAAIVQQHILRQYSSETAAVQQQILRQLCT